MPDAVAFEASASHSLTGVNPIRLTTSTTTTMYGFLLLSANPTILVLWIVVAGIAAMVLRQVVRRVIQLISALMSGCLLWLMLLLLVGLYISQHFFSM
ncbi:MAG: hypothetical protein IT269_13785 [Saprospiraceae bacterium]|nr:hypothetical protein [Saprospiraceae bacterium]